MNLKLFLSQFYVPDSLKKRYLARLFELAEEAFEACGGHFRQKAGLDEALREFAVFTKTRAERIVNDEERSLRAQTILFYGARSLGRQLRRDLAVTDCREACIAARSVYRGLKIDFTCDSEGNATFWRCFFSDFYSAQVCSLIWALDRGLIDGLTGGMRMTFTGRVTQNLPCCTARITP